MLRSFHVNLTALSLIALIVGMFLIYNSTTDRCRAAPSGAGDPARPGGPTAPSVSADAERSFGHCLLAALLGVGLGLLLARLALRLVSPAVSALYVLET